MEWNEKYAQIISRSVAGNVAVFVSPYTKIFMFRNVLLENKSH
jgi:hypothetical protein